MFHLLTSGPLLRVPGWRAAALSLPPDIDETEVHPVVEGDALALKTLGDGQYSTVWRVRDGKLEEAALKLMTSLAGEKRGPDELGTMTIPLEGPHLQASRLFCSLRTEWTTHLSDSSSRAPSDQHACWTCIGALWGRCLRSYYSSHLLHLYRLSPAELLERSRTMMTGVEFPEDQAILTLNGIELLKMTHKLTDFGSANRMSRWAAMIQRVGLRSPEVPLGSNRYMEFRLLGTLTPDSGFL
ncbi:hypothetical protein B0H19DRAFT_1302462 [Mycena capillaripes]|nr:hypothetical protein B0H19DRAFT_1302462 [Mycena capillaripes]